MGAGVVTKFMQDAARDVLGRAFASLQLIAFIAIESGRIARLAALTRRVDSKE